MICNSCGKEIANGQTTCPYCYFDNEAITKFHMDFAERPTDVYFLENQPAEKKRVNPVVLVSIAVVAVTVLLVGVFLIVFLGNNNGVNTTNDYNSHDKENVVVATNFDALTYAEVVNYEYGNLTDYAMTYIRENDSYLMTVNHSSTDDEYNTYETEVRFDKEKRIKSVKTTCYARIDHVYQSYNEYQYIYNADGVLTSKNYFSDYSSGTVIYNYDADGRLLSEVLEENGPGWSHEYFYDDAGRLICKTLGFTFGMEEHYEYNGMQLVAKKLYNPEGGFYEAYESFGRSATNQFVHYSFNDSDYYGESTLNFYKNFLYDTDNKLTTVELDYQSDSNGICKAIGTYVYDKENISKITFTGTRNYELRFEYRNQPGEFDGLLDAYIQDQYGVSADEYFYY